MGVLSKRRDGAFSAAVVDFSHHAAATVRVRMEAHVGRCLGPIQECYLAAEIVVAVFHRQ